MKENVSFGFLMDRAVKAERLDLSQRFKRMGVDLTPDQWHILTLLFKNKKGHSQNELALSSFKDAPTVSRIIDLMCKKGFTQRLPFEGDRRRHQVTISQKGIDTVNLVMPEAEKNKELGLEGLSESDLESLTKIVSRVYANYAK